MKARKIISLLLAVLMLAGMATVFASCADNKVGVAKVSKKTVDTPKEACEARACLRRVLTLVRVERHSRRKFRAGRAGRSWFTYFFAVSGSKIMS